VIESLYKYYVGNLSSFDIDLVWMYGEFRGWPYSHIPMIGCHHTDSRAIMISLCRNRTRMGRSFSVFLPA
jgi:hypothetical protein